MLKPTDDYNDKNNPQTSFLFSLIQHGRPALIRYHIYITHSKDFDSTETYD